MVQDQTTISAEFDYDRILSSKPFTFRVISQEMYKALCGQCFRFDVLDQQRVFYREMQFLSGICESMLAEYHTHRVPRNSGGAFDPEYVARRSIERVVVSSMDFCFVLTRIGILSEGQGAVILHQCDGVS